MSSANGHNGAPRSTAEMTNDPEKGGSSLHDRIAALETKLEGPGYMMNPPHSIRVANCGPLGLFAFGYTTALLACTYTKWTPGGTTQFALAAGLFYGGLVQLLAGMWGIWRNNTFAGTAFSSYGGFWMAFGIHGILSEGGVFLAVEDAGEQAFLALWAVFTFCLLLQTANINVALMALFTFLTLAFACLSAGAAHPRALKAGGYCAMAAAFMAFYTALAELTNEVYRRTIMPLFVLNVATAHIVNNDPRPDTL